MPNNEDKNETSRFLGEGVSFKAKLIGILEVSEARGDRMCQEALADLKMAIRAAGEHKQRITINIAIDGLRLRDEKTGDSLYHHPVHKISFIAQDMSDSRAFGYIFGSPDTGHRFFGIKTDKAASQVVIAMRDLFQVVFALKKKEIELAKQHLDKSRYTNTSLFSESAQAAVKIQSISQEPTKTTTEAKSTNTEENKSGGAAVADLVDLELELNHLQQGLTQMERITPSDPFGSKDDPFGDSFISYPKPILPPPPSGRERARVSSETKSTESFESSDTSFFKDPKASKIFDFQPDFGAEQKSDWFAATSASEPLTAAPPVDEHEAKKLEILSQFDVFTELDPLGTGKIKPYVDKKHFFQELKNPPKKVLNDLVSTQTTTGQEPLEQKPNNRLKSNVFESDPFGEDPFKEDPFAETDFLKQDPFNTDNCIVSGERTAVGLFNNMKAQTFGFQFDAKKETAGLDLNADAPAPPPRPVASNIVQIDPPPLPPKKVKPPPRPPYHEEGKFDGNESGQSSLELSRSTEMSPPLPPPQRRPKLEWPPRQGGATSDDEYLTPISIEPPNTEPTFEESKQDEDLDGLDITLSQLTLSGLNELAMKLHIPASQLSNMTLAQLTSYLSNFIKNKRKSAKDSAPKQPSQTFKADFVANFGTTTEQSDRYAAFRDLFREDAPPPVQPLLETQQTEKEEHIVAEAKINNTDVCISKEDRYAALREIVEMEFKEGNEVKSEDVEIENLKNEEVLLENETNIFKTSKEVEEKGNDDVIKYSEPLNIIQEARSPLEETKTAKSPCLPVVTEIIQNSTHPTSGSLSDVISGSSPEIDNTGSASEIGKKSADAAGESWAIFDQSNLQQEENNNKPTTTQSEEGVSPWSSDSKEFGNASPPDWRHRQDSSSCGEKHYRRRPNRDQESWWDTSAEPEVNYYPNRHSTDSYEDECINYYDHPRHRRQIGWRLESGGGGGGGHSSSSRDVSPLEDEQSRRDPRESWRRHQEAFARWRERRRTDSWDEDDDFEYEEEHARPHWPEHYRRDVERDRHSASSREHEAEREDERKYRRRRETDRTKCCCPDRDLEFQGVRYGSGRFSGPPRHDKKQHEEYYYPRDSQESLWDDEYSNEREDPYLHYATAKRNWKRPSSASEMERKAAERSSRQPYLGAGGSDGERDRKYKSTRRSRSRDSQYSDTTYNRPGPPLRRQKHPHKPYETYPTNPVETKKEPPATQKKFKEHLKVRQESLPATLPRKTPPRTTFESDFAPSEGDSPIPVRQTKRFNLENDFGEEKPQKSLFEDDFLPSERHEGSTISSIKEEGGEEDMVGKLEKKFSQKRGFGKRGFSMDVNLKKSESVNIFTRENDPFDDDFFSEGACGNFRRGGGGKWSENFDEFGDDERL